MQFLVNRLLIAKFSISVDDEFTITNTNPMISSAKRLHFLASMTHTNHIA